MMASAEDNPEESAMPSSFRSLFKFLRYQAPEINGSVRIYLGCGFGGDKQGMVARPFSKVQEVASSFF